MHEFLASPKFSSVLDKLTAANVMVAVSSGDIFQRPDSDAAGTNKDNKWCVKKLLCFH
jgi:hypothetical protein